MALIPAASRRSIPHTVPFIRADPVPPQIEPSAQSWIALWTGTSTRPTNVQAITALSKVRTAATVHFLMCSTSQTTRGFSCLERAFNKLLFNPELAWRKLGSAQGAFRFPDFGRNSRCVIARMSTSNSLKRKHRPRLQHHPVRIASRLCETLRMKRSPSRTQDLNHKGGIISAAAL